MKIKFHIYRSVVLSLIVSIEIIPALLDSSVAEKREIPESMKHLFACNETISLNEIIYENDQLEKSKHVLISGKVNCENK